MTPETRFWRPEDNSSVRCLLCPHACLIPVNSAGTCGVRVNRGGKLTSLVNGRIAACQVDPVEKKPLYHYLPGSLSLSLGTSGCNFSCLFCQNSELSQSVKAGAEPAGFSLSPGRAVSEARARGCDSISYTYNEPTVFLEYVLETATLAKESGLGNIAVTNGYIARKPLDGMASLLDAVNVDFKSIRDDFYREICGGSVKPVLETMVRFRETGTWLEVTTLLIPGLNDTDGETRRIAAFIRDELGAETPWHLSGFHPCYRMVDRPPTPPVTLERAEKIARDEGLVFVYLGNLAGGKGRETKCPSCGETLIRREYFSVSADYLEKGRCPSCRHQLPGVFD